MPSPPSSTMTWTGLLLLRLLILLATTTTASAAPLPSDTSMGDEPSPPAEASTAAGANSHPERPLGRILGAALGAGLGATLVCAVVLWLCWRCPVRTRATAARMHECDDMLADSVTGPAAQGGGWQAAHRHGADTAWLGGAGWGRRAGVQGSLAPVAALGVHAG